jgi:hypothetical protein
MIKLKESYNDYVYSYETDINLEKLRHVCYGLKDFINSNYKLDETSLNIGPLTTRLYNKYNVVQFVLPETHKVYQVICKAANKHIQDWSVDWYMQCWLNWYEEGESIDWHRHPITNPTSLHGFICVDCQGSETFYKLLDGSEFSVPSIDGNIIIGPSDGDEHSTKPWRNDKKPRITLAFDILPAIHQENRMPEPNHLVPILREIT